MNIGIQEKEINNLKLNKMCNSKPKTSKPSPNWPSKKEGNASGGKRDNNPPKNKK